MRARVWLGTTTPHMVLVLYWYGAMQCLYIQKNVTIQRGPQMAKWPKNWHQKIQKNILLQIALMSFIHISNLLAVKHKKVIGHWGCHLPKNKNVQNCTKIFSIVLV